MDDQPHKPAAPVAREHLPDWLTTEWQEQLVAEHTSWSRTGDHRRPTLLLGGFAAGPHLTVTVWTSG